MIASPYGRACVIVMTLARIGNDPDLKRLAAIRSIGGGREIYGAGGIRDAADLSALKAAGPSGGALIATALHQGRVTRRIWKRSESPCLAAIRASYRRDRT